MYVCGPTVYGPPHLGHGRFSLVFDVLRRYLEWTGLEVRYVSNITDIDDNIIDRANREGGTSEEIAVECEALWYRGDGRDQREAPDRRSPCHRVRGRDDRPHRGARRSRQRLRHQRRRLPLRRDGRGLWLARAPVARGHASRRRRALTRRRGEAVARRLRALEAREARRAVVGVAVGRGPPGLAHRVRGDVARPPRRGLRPPRRRAGPRVPPPRERAGPGGRARASLRHALGAQRVRRGRRREDVEVARQLHEPARPHREGRSACLPVARAAVALPVSHRDQQGHDRSRGAVARGARCVRSPSRLPSCPGWARARRRHDPAVPRRDGRRPQHAGGDGAGVRQRAAGQRCARRGRRRSRQRRSPRPCSRSAARSVSCCGPTWPRSPPRSRRSAAERDEARAAKDFARADAIRGELQADGWIVEDTASGTLVRRP